MAQKLPEEKRKEIAKAIMSKYGTTAAMCQATGLHRNTISKLLNGHTKELAFCTAVMIEEALGVKITS